MDGAGWADAPDWLLRMLVAFLSQHDAYCLYVCAVEWRLPALRSFLTRRSPFAPLDRKRAKHVAMAHGCWTAICRFSRVDHSAPVGRYRLPVRTVDRILEELRALLGPSLLPHPHRRLAMLTTASRGSVPAFVMYTAAQHGCLESVMWLHYVVEHDPSLALEAAASHGHGAVVAWILAHGLDPPSNANPYRRVQDVLEYRSPGGIEITLWVDVNPMVNGRSVKMFSPQWGYASQYSTRNVFPIADVAAQHGDLATMQHILSLQPFSEACSTTAVEYAASAGHLHILKWLRETHPAAFRNSIALRFAIQNGHIDVAEWLIAQRLGGSSLLSLSEAIAINGDLPTLQWILAAIPAIQPVEIALHAARTGHLHLVEWLVTNVNLVVTIRLVKTAAGHGHLKMVQWLLSHCEDDEVDISVAMSAASSGNCALVKWMVETYACWDPILFSCATRTASTATLAYLFDLAIIKSRELDVPLTSVLRVKREEWIYRGHYETLTWLLCHGFCDSILNKRSFDQTMLLDRVHLKQQECLGWRSEIECAVPIASTSDMARFRAMVEVVIAKYEPATLRKVAWLPEWAARERSVISLERLLEIRHPLVLSRRVFRKVLHSTNDECMAKWFLLQKPSLFSLYVLKWALAFDHTCFVRWILDEFLPSQTGTEVGASLRHHAQRIVTSS